MEIKKSSIEQAKADYNEIKDFALNEAMKQVRNKITPKLDEIVKAALNESVSIEAGEVKIEVPASEEIIIAKEDGTEVKISGEGSTSAVATEEPATNTEDPGMEEEPIEEPVEEPIEDESFSDDDEIEVDLDGDGEDDSDDEEFIVGDEDGSEDDNEEETISEAEEIELPENPAPAAPTTPAAPVAPDATATPIENPAESMTNPFDVIMQKLEAIESKINGGGSEDGQVEIVDDETAPAPDATAAPAAPAAPAPTPEEEPVQEEFLLEMEDEVFLPGEEFESEEEIVAEIIDETDDSSMTEETLEEMMGISTTVKNQANRRKEEINESKIKAQYESTLDELIKENESLKQTINDYKKSFIDLRDQFNEMQTFNAKLAYANKLFINGGLSTEEKMNISEQFDKTKTIDEAKELFRKLVKEGVATGTTKKSAEEKIKSQTISVASPAKSETLFESAEVKRMKRLGGIIKDSEE